MLHYFYHSYVGSLLFVVCTYEQIIVKLIARRCSIVHIFVETSNIINQVLFLAFLVDLSYTNTFVYSKSEKHAFK